MSTQKTFRIWCRVKLWPMESLSQSGGITRTREAWLKASGKIYETHNKETAQRKAANLNKTMEKNSMASFHYSVVEM